MNIFEEGNPEEIRADRNRLRAILDDYTRVVGVVLPDKDYILDHLQLELYKARRSHLILDYILIGLFIFMICTLIVIYKSGGINP